MTVLSVADACRRLGIDAKTLRRWLADAQLSLQSHPCDGRKKGVSEEHLELLARLHHRHIASLLAEPPATEALDLSELPTTLLALPEQISALQAQIIALQQQVADLLHLLKPHAPLPVGPAKSRKRSSTPAPSAPRSHPEALTPRKPVPVIPRVEYGEKGHYVVICPKRGVLPFEPDTPEWFAWVAKQSSFRFVGKEGHFSAHHEWTTPRGAWRAHRQIRNHSYNLPLAPNQHLTIAVLEQAAHALHAHLA